MPDRGLLDELRVWRHPVLSGNAKPSDLLHRDATQPRFDLVDTEVHSTGMVILAYRPRPG